MTQGDTDKTGYKNPPKHTQWKKGQSGNPNGRPKKSDNAATLDDFYDDFLKMLDEKAVVKMNDELVTLPYEKIIMNKLVSKAMKGDHKSIKLITDLRMNALKSKSRDPKENGGIQIMYLDADDRFL